MKKAFTILFISGVFISAYSQDITNTLGTNGTFRITDETPSNLLNVSSTGNLDIIGNSTVGGNSTVSGKMIVADSIVSNGPIISQAIKSINFSNSPYSVLSSDLNDIVDTPKLDFFRGSIPSPYFPPVNASLTALQL